MFTLNPLFSDHAVLQQGVLLPIWGTGESYSEIEVSVGSSVARTMVSTAGKWLVHLPAMSAGGPHVLLAKNLTSGETLRREDIMIGEVWLASGQSNMEFRLENQHPYHGLHSNVRMFSVPLSLNYGAAHAIDSCWQRSDDGDSALRFSAVASYFAQRLSEQLGVTVGILSSSFGGSDVLSWISRESLLCDPECAAAVRSCDEQLSRPGFSPLEDAPVNPHLVNYYEEHPLPAAAERGIREKWFASEYDDSTWESANLPAHWGSFTSDENGAFWFRKQIVLPEGWGGKEIQLSLGAADKQDITYVNGVEIGRTGSGFCEITWNMVRRYKIPAELTRNGTLLIAVRVYSFFMDGGLNGKAQDMFLKLDDELISLADEWKYRREFSCGRVRDIPADKNRRLPFHILPDNCPGIMFENMIRPLLPYAFRGTIWYQGEHNTNHRPESYERLMELLVRDWRWHAGIPQMPFHQVSLANFHAPSSYQHDSTWAPIRNIQHRLGQKLGFHAIPAYDVGDALDIHFPDKRAVGTRLADIVLQQDYRHGPLCSLEAERITFASQDSLLIKCNAGTKLYATAGESLFMVSDLEKQNFVRCSYAIDGSAIRVQIPREVLRPRYIRYAWADNPAGAVIYNEFNFPLAPFEQAIL